MRISRRNIAPGINRDSLFSPLFVPVTLPLKATVSLDPIDLTTSLCAEAEFPGPKPLPYCPMRGHGLALPCKWAATMKILLLPGIPTFRLRTAPGSSLP